MPLLQLCEIHKSFHETAVLRGVSLDLEPGEVHALVGANGAGKSTLIKVLAGAYSRDSGEVLIDGRAAALKSPREALGLGIGVIYQEFNLVPELSVAENVLLGQEPRGRAGLLSRRALLAEARRHLQELGFPLDAARPVRELATGEKQLVEIARALHRRARVLVLDEPTAALSRPEVERLFGLMRTLQERGVGMIYISHHLEEVFLVADRITVLRDGQNVATWSRGQVSEAGLVRAMIGHEIEEQARHNREPGETVLEASALSGDGFRDVSLRARRGEILALTGAAGAGQSALLWALAGASRTTSGELRLHGRPTTWRSPREAVRRGVVFAPGDRKAYGILSGLSVQTNLTFADWPRWTRMGLLRWGAVADAALRRTQRYGVRCHSARQEVQLLSGGNQQKVIVARVAERGAAIYLFDEPTRGVDVGAREELYRLMHRLAEGGASVLVATGDVQEALGFADRVAVMRGGRPVYEAAVSRTTEHEVLTALLGADA